MNPIKRWDIAPCPACGADKGQPCDYTPTYPPAGRTTHVERQFAVINRWFQARVKKWQSVACPISKCGAGIGKRCNEESVFASKGDLWVHPARMRLAEAGQEREGVTND